MSLDPSLKIKGGLSGKRSVMTRAERVAALKQDKKFNPKKHSVLGLPKTKVPE
ncbi:MAG: small basic protein [Planctomycetota bacterium]